MLIDAPAQGDVDVPIYRKEEHMTVGKLRQVLADLPDDVVVILQSADTPHPVHAEVRKIREYEQEELPWATRVLELWS